MKLTKATVLSLVEAFPRATGRDVKQLCRLVRVNHGTSPKLEHFKNLAAYKPGGFGKD